MYAVIATGGKQFKVQEKDVVAIEKLNGEVGSKVTFTEVLAMGEGADLKVGAPYVEGATVSGTADKTGKQKKIIVFKYKAKKNYRRRQGHRQPYTKLVIKSVKA